MNVALHFRRARALAALLLIASAIFGCAGRSDESEPGTIELGESVQPTLKIRGTVSDAMSRPLSGVTIQLQGASKASTTTQSNGTYGFIGLHRGAYSVEPSRAGCTMDPPSVKLTGLTGDAVVNFHGSGPNCVGAGDAGAPDASSGDAGRTDASPDARPIDSCVPKTCQGAEVACGPLSNGCGLTLQCGSCPVGQTCNSSGQCVCQPSSTCPAGQICGTAPNGCGGVLNCGSCPAGMACNTAGTACVSVCVPHISCTGAQNCGTQDNGCGTPLSCGTCSGADTCGGGGQPGVCGQPQASPCAQFNAGGPCTPTEQRFVSKSVACYTCMANSGCLDDALFMDSGHECGDVTGTAVKGGATGTSRTQLCLDTIDCIMNPANLCASTDVTICYCGTLGAGNGCATAPAGAADGKCLTQELNGLEHLASEAPSVVLPDFTNMFLGAGMANQLFNCAKANACDVLCSQ